MDKQMVTGHNPQADAQKTASTKGTDGEKGQAGSEALSFSFTQDGKEIDLSGYVFGIHYSPILTKIGEYKIPKISGFKMARIV